jgi:hypothetical protein
MNKSNTNSGRYPVGTILRSTWGYNMTINSFFQVVAITPNGIKVRAINSSQSGGQIGKERPIKDSFDKYCVISGGKERIVLLKRMGREISPSLGRYNLSVAEEGAEYGYNYMD